MTYSEKLYREFSSIAYNLEQIEKMSMRDTELSHKIDKIKFQKKDISSVFGKWSLIGLLIMVPVSAASWLTSLIAMRFVFWTFAFNQPAPMWWRSIENAVALVILIAVFSVGYGAILLFSYLFAKDHNERGLLKVNNQKEMFKNEQIRNKQEAIKIYRRIRDYIQTNIPQEYRSSEDIRRIAHYFKQYELNTIPAAISYYDKDLKNGFYDK